MHMWPIVCCVAIAVAFGSSAELSYAGIRGDVSASAVTSSVARVVARAGTNMTLACPGLTPTSYVYLVEWKCIGCKCTGCPDPNGEGTRILRYNNELTRWDTASQDEVARRTLDTRTYGLKFGPVRADDTGTYLCLINNRREPDAPLLLTVEDVPDPPPSRPMVLSADSRTVNLSWAPPRKVHNHPVTAYKILIKEGEEEGDWNRTLETGSNTTSQYIDGLRPFTLYFFRVAAQNALGYSKASRESYPTMTHRERPSGRPEFLRERLSTSSTSLSLVWQPPPKSTLNGEFLGYLLTYKPTNYEAINATNVTVSVKDLRVQNYTIRNLEKHTDYRVTVGALNLRGLGPQAVIELRTEDGVPLEPLSPRIRNVTSRWIELTWQPPSNAASLGSDLLGYRVYVEELCDANSKKKRRRRLLKRRKRLRRENDDHPKCREITPETVHGAKSTVVGFHSLTPFTKYRFKLRAFTKRREGPASETLVVVTDTEASSPPRVTNISCYGVNELLVEWRRPEVTYDGIQFYRIHLRSIDGVRRDQELSVEVMNETLRYVAYLSNLTTQSRYDLSVSAFVESHLRPGVFYQSRASSSKRVYLGRECDPLQAFSKVPHEIFEYNAGILVGIIATASVLLLILILILVCKKHRPQYETIALTPRKYWPGCNSSSEGWYGDPETNIPALLFPKHVLGMHASDDLAFQRDFEAVHSASKRMNNGASAKRNANNGAASAFPDILNGGRDVVNVHSPMFMDGWQSGRGFISVLCEAPFTLDSTWKMIWEQKVSIIVTLLTSVAKDDLSTLSDTKSFGDVMVSLHNEDILPDYTIRTMKVCSKKSRKCERLVSQLIFPRWPEVGLPLGADFLHFVKAAFACRQSSCLPTGKLLIHSRSGLDPCILYATLETMLSELRCRGELNVSHYSKHLSAESDLALSSADQYVYVHDTLAAAIECGHLHGVIQAKNGTLNHNGTTGDGTSEYSAHAV